MSTLEPLPKYLPDSFEFGDQPQPAHREEDPATADYADLWEVSTYAPLKDEWETLATDIPTPALAAHLARAAVKYQELHLLSREYSKDIVTTHPNGTHTVIYRGKRAIT